MHAILLLTSAIAFAAPAKPLRVELMGANGQSVGEALLTQQKKGVKFEVSVSNLPPGPHGFHVHEIGECTPVDFKSAGSHFAPGHKNHGKVAGGPHEGDLPNITVGKDGKGKASFTNKLVTLQDGETNSLIRTGGTALVLHAKADDGKSQPAGDSGDRIACGVIGGDKNAP